MTEDLTVLLPAVASFGVSVYLLFVAIVGYRYSRWRKRLASVGIDTPEYGAIYAEYRKVLRFNGEYVFSESDISKAMLFYRTAGFLRPTGVNWSSDKESVAHSFTSNINTSSGVRLLTFKGRSYLRNAGTTPHNPR